MYGISSISPYKFPPTILQKKTATLTPENFCNVLSVCCSPFLELQKQQGTVKRMAEEPWKVKKRIIADKANSKQFLRDRDSLSDDTNDEIVNIKMDRRERGQIKMEFKSHGRVHKLHLKESKQQLSDIPIQLLGQHETVAKAAKDELKVIAFISISPLFTTKLLKYIHKMKHVVFKSFNGTDW